MAGKFFFSAAEDEKLVEYVSAFPGLYDSEDRDYKDRVSRENSWEQIATNVNRSTEECKKRWRNIKDTYFKLQRNKIRGLVSRSRSRWPLLKQLTFLDAIPTKRRVIINEENVFEDIDSNDANNSSLEDSNDCTNLDPLRTTTKIKQSPPSSTTNKRQKISNSQMFDAMESESELSEANNIENINWKNDDEDPILLFFKSMAMTVKTFEPQVIPEVKSRIFNVVNEFEIRSIQRKQNSCLQQTNSEETARETPINIETKYSYSSSFHHSDIN